jgi:methyl-accepting chemotaxis protein
MKTLREHIKIQEANHRQLMNQLFHQGNFNREVASQFEKLKDSLNGRLEQQDHKLMNVLKEFHEMKQYLQQIVANQKEQKKKGFFARLFKKG